MFKPLVASSELDMIAAHKDGIAHLRFGKKPKITQTKDTESFIRSAVSKWGMRPVSNSQEVDGFPVIEKTKTGEYNLVGVIPTGEKKRMGHVENPWVPHVGKRGGKGWRHKETNEVRYQKDRPGATEGGGEPEGETGDQAPDAQTPWQVFKDALTELALGIWEEIVASLSPRTGQGIEMTEDDAALLNELVGESTATGEARAAELGLTTDQEVSMKFDVKSVKALSENARKLANPKQEAAVHRYSTVHYRNLNKNLRACPETLKCLNREQKSCTRNYSHSLNPKPPTSRETGNLSSCGEAWGQLPGPHSWKTSNKF